jgi:hypothetical protein
MDTDLTGENRGNGEGEKGKIIKEFNMVSGSAGTRDNS